MQNASKTRVTPKKLTATNTVTTVTSYDTGVSDDINQRDTLIMFVDIAGASEASNYLSSKEYERFVTAFQDEFINTCLHFIESNMVKGASLKINLKIEEHYTLVARGDEGLMMLYPPKLTESPANNKSRLSKNDVRMSRYLDVAIHIALRLKRRWLLCKNSEDWCNFHRIRKSEILPIDLGIGIHIGKTYISPKKEIKIRESKDIARKKQDLPEGYAINLAKRVEGHSRKGKYSRIFVSEAAHAYAEMLHDEKTYIFADPTKLEAKGFSRDIHAFELRHHFLSANWSDDLIDIVLAEKKGRSKDLASRAERSRVILDPLSSDELKTLRAAHQLNPTNIWLAEEYIRSSMIGELEKKIREFIKSNANSKNMRDKLSGYLKDADFAKTMYKEASRVSSYLIQNDQRDPGALVIQGLVEGERREFFHEVARYDDAEKFTNSLAMIHWYKGTSFSTRAKDAFDWQEIKNVLQSKEKSKNLYINLGADIDRENSL